MLVTGFAMVAEMAASNAVLQTIVEEEKRGRVMSFYTMAFFGMGPLGSLLAGALAGMIGILPTFLTFGTICLTASVVFAALLPSLRERYGRCTFGPAFSVRPTMMFWQRSPLLRPQGHNSCQSLCRPRRSPSNGAPLLEWDCVSVLIVGIEGPATIRRRPWNRRDRERGQANGDSRDSPTTCELPAGDQ